MSELTLAKWHGAGNDFLIALTERSNSPRWSSEMARALCDRHVGLGADGLIVATRDRDSTTMVLFNADGSRAEMSGNGIRCLAAELERSSAKRVGRWEIVTDAGPRSVSIDLNEQGNEGSGEVTMGTVSFGPDIECAIGVVGLGNPHVVVRDEPQWEIRDREDLATTLSSQVGGANVEFVTVISRQHVTICVVERGVGWTLACGTGSVATAAVLARLGEVDASVVVSNPGGDLVVHLDRTSARLAGPVRFVGTMTWDAP